LLGCEIKQTIKELGMQNISHNCMYPRYKY